MKRILSYVLSFFAIAILYSQETTKDFIFFDHDKHELSLAEQFHLSMISDRLKSHADFSTHIYGHTDLDGSAKYNEVLALKRAKSVYDYFIEEGVHSNQIVLKSFGEVNPLEDGGSEASKAKNRRVEIFTTYSIFESLDEVVGKIETNAKQNFSFDNSLEKTLFLEKGSSVKIPANAFITEDGSFPEGEIQVELIESFSYTDFVKDGLTTMSGDRILETGGMMYINATADGKQLILNNGQSIEIMYPEQGTIDGMELFYGQQQENGAMDWASTNQKIPASFVKNTNSKWEGFDFSAWLEYDIKIPDRPIFDVKPLPKKPGFPRKAYDALKPTQPQREKVKLNKSKFSQFFMSKAKKEELRDIAFEQAMQKYQNDLVLYEDGHQKYLDRSEAYKKEYPIAVQRINDWEKLAREKMVQILEYRTRLKIYYDAVRVKRAQRYLSQNMNEMRPDDMFQVFLDMVNQPLEIGFSDNYFQKVYGRHFVKIIRDLRLFAGDVRKIKLNATNAHLYKLSNSINTKNIENRFKKDGKIGTETINRYVANISQLGWINIDKFYDFDESEALQMAINESDNAKFYIVFKNQRTVISPDKLKNHYRFDRLRKGEELKLVGIKLIDAKPYLFQQDIVMDDNKVVEVDYESTTLEEIKKLFNELDGNAG
jgi:hypothetical protein